MFRVPLLILDIRILDTPILGAKRTGIFSLLFMKKRLLQSVHACQEKNIQKELLPKKIQIEREMTRILLAAGPVRPFILTLYHILARINEVLR
jgi:hypothetical protein